LRLADTGRCGDAWLLKVSCRLWTSLAQGPVRLSTIAHPAARAGPGNWLQSGSTVESKKEAVRDRSSGQFPAQAKAVAPMEHPNFGAKRRVRATVFGCPAVARW
jgi:hypothetical protein